MSTDLPVQPVSGNLGVALSRTATEPTTDTAFCPALLNSTEGLSFNTYQRYMDNAVLRRDDRRRHPQLREGPHQRQKRDASTTSCAAPAALHRLRRLSRHQGGDRSLRDGELRRARRTAFDNAVPRQRARRAYLQRRDLPVPGSADRVHQPVPGAVPRRQGAADKTLPYLAVIRPSCPTSRSSSPRSGPRRSSCRECTGILQDKLTNPCLLELIWSYWHEEGMLVQTMNAITRRFQNVRAPVGDDPLANMEIDPLRPLNNLLWGYVQDEQHRLTRGAPRLRVRPPLRPAARGQGGAATCGPPTAARSSSRRSTTCCSCARVFYKQDDDTTVDRRRFPGAERAQGSAPDPVAGRAQPVRRPAVDRAHRDADAAVDPGAAGVPRVPADAHHGRLSRSRGWIASTR